MPRGSNINHPKLKAMRVKLQDCAADWRKGKKLSNDYKRHVAKCLRKGR